jgi:ATP-dependent 26S proteasome regulatory subunit
LRLRTADCRLPTADCSLPDWTNLTPQRIITAAMSPPRFQNLGADASLPMRSENLKLLVQAGNPIISMETPDEPRAAATIGEVAQQLGLPLSQWSITEGLSPVPPSPSKPLVEPGKAAAALQYIKKSLYPAIYLFKDLGPHCKDPQVVRALRDLYFSPDTRLWTLMLVDAAGLPQEVRRMTVPFELGWPDQEELEKIVRGTFQEVQRRSTQQIESKLTKRELEILVQSLRGLTTEEAVRVVAGAIRADNVLDVSDLPRIIDAKRSLLGTTGCLESIAADVSPDEIGGLKNLKRWLNLRCGGFSARAREFGIEPPRGILLLGVQGCGKSLCAKVVASAWRMPLMRMDPGVLYQKYIGESEARLREALAQAESMSPVVLWIDEIEKAFASANSDSADGGLSQRMFGTLLSWMQDHRHPIFLIATANNLARLPPELMRKGRFDEIFFIDLPAPTEREAIFAVHLKKRNRDRAKFDMAGLTAASEGLSGAEIEQAVISGLYAAFSEASECTTEHILTAIRATQPLSVVMREDVERLRHWAQGRCVMAD